MRLMRKRRNHLESVRIVIIYAIFGSLWIYLSDTILGWMTKEQAVLTQISVYKGLLFILLTSTLLYVLIARQLSRVAEFNRQLAESETRFVSIFNNISDAVLILDASDYRIVDANDSVTVLFGFTREETLARDIGDMCSGEEPFSRNRMEDLLRRAKTEAHVICEWHCQDKEGVPFWAECSIRAAHIGDSDAIIVAIRDITERKQVAESLRRSEHFSSTLNRISRAFLIGADEEETFDHVLAAVQEIMESPYGVFGFLDESGSLVCPAMTRSVWSECNVKDKSFVFPQSVWGHSSWGKCLKTGVAHCSNRTFVVPEGHLRIDRCLTVPLVYQGVSIGLLSVANKSDEYTDQDQQTLQAIAEYTAPVLYARLEQHRATRALVESENRLRVLFETTPAGIILVNPSGEITFTNSHMAEMLGWRPEQVAGSEYLSHIHPDERAEGGEEFRCLTASEISAASSERRFLKADGDTFWGYLSSRRYEGADGSLISIVSVISDTNELKQAEAERRKLEQQMLHVQKLESLGVLAGGIAHDFNNILLAITGNASLALMRLSPESPAVSHLQQIEVAADKAADLARQMLAYSGKGRFVLEALNLNHIIEEMANMLQVSISKKAVLRYNYSPHLPSVVADATQIRQVVMNLAINASEAIGDRSGVISISTGCMECDQKYLRETWIDENLTEGLYVFLEVADTGCGMERATMERIFDPFFTTKFTGRGLGMAAILGIVRGHRGAIKVYSEPGRGSNFKILLPASDRPVELYNGVHAGSRWRGSGLALLVDDEETIRAIGSDMLKELGFKVVTATDGREALEVFQRMNAEIRFVLLDLTMPRMNGEDAFRELRRIKPDVRVIISSGYNEQKFHRNSWEREWPIRSETLQTVNVGGGYQKQS